jgi:predicted RNase H-like HicB family nuclease
MAIAHVTYNYEPGSWWIESEEYPGYTAFAASRAEATQLAREGLRFFADDPELEIVGLDQLEAVTSADAPEGRFALSASVSGLMDAYMSAAVPLAHTGAGK